MAEDLLALFAQVRDFDWDPSKRKSNLRDHKIDFEDLKGIFEDYTFIRRSDRRGEVRYHVFGYVHGREIAVACTLRGDICWLISARPASRKERREYYQHLEGQSATGKD